MRVKERKMKWPLIIDRSSQQLHSHLHSPPFKTIFALLFLAIVLPIALPIASIFGDVFDLKLCDSDGFNDDLNVLNNGTFDCAVISSPTNNIIDISGAAYTLAFNYGPTGVGLAVNNEIGFDLVGALTAATAATIMNENENKMIFNSGSSYGQHTQTQGHHPITPGIDRYDSIGSTGAVLVEFNDTVCIFNGNIDRNGFDDNTTLGYLISIF